MKEKNGREKRKEIGDKRRKDEEERRRRRNKVVIIIIHKNSYSFIIQDFCLDLYTA